jgi:CBS domain-containing protein
MRVSEVMSRNVQVARPHQTIQEAAKMMSEMDVGALPVAQDDRLVGMITDRDIAIRAVAQNEGPSTKVRDVWIPNSASMTRTPSRWHATWATSKCDACSWLTATGSWLASWRSPILPNRAARGRRRKRTTHPIGVCTVALCTLNPGC